MNIIDHSPNYRYKDLDIVVLEVLIDDIKSYAEKMVSIVQSESWISRLSISDRVSYTSRFNKTRDKLVSIFKEGLSPISAEFGEYLVSIVSQNTLMLIKNHTEIPLSELFKEKISGNPGFDYHSLDPDEVLVFGESKYSSNSNPYSEAINQCLDFIVAEKDNMDLVHLKNFVSEHAVDNFALYSKKYYSVSFSITSDNSKIIFNHAFLSASHFEIYKKWFIIGVKIND